METTLNLDPDLLRKAGKAAAEMGTSISAIVEDSLKRFLVQQRPVLQAPPEGGRRGSLDRTDPFFAILDQIEEERHSRLPREPIRFD